MKQLKNSRTDGAVWDKARSTMIGIVHKVVGFQKETQVSPAFRDRWMKIESNPVSHDPRSVFYVGPPAVKNGWLYQLKNWLRRY